jgi:hypothetical protein
MKIEYITEYTDTNKCPRCGRTEFIPGAMADGRACVKGRMCDYCGLILLTDVNLIVYEGLTVKYKPVDDVPFLSE